MRVTDAMVRGFLLWARNYGEIKNFERIEGGGRCWKITLRGVVRAHGGAGPLLPVFGEDDPNRVVPLEFVLTAREALAFGYGLAVGGASERRSDFAAREWDWDEEAPAARPADDEPAPAPADAQEAGELPPPQ